jgi:hypothetical protein
LEELAVTLQIHVFIFEHKGQKTLANLVRLLTPVFLLEQVVNEQPAV